MSARRENSPRNAIGFPRVFVGARRRLCQRRKLPPWAAAARSDGLKGTCSTVTEGALNALRVARRVEECSLPGQAQALPPRQLELQNHVVQRVGESPRGNASADKPPDWRVRLSAALQAVHMLRRMQVLSETAKTRIVLGGPRSVVAVWRRQIGMRIGRPTLPA